MACGDDFQKKIYSVFFESYINYFILNISIEMKTQSDHPGLCTDMSTFIQLFQRIDDLKKLKQKFRINRTIPPTPVQFLFPLLKIIASLVQLNKTAHINLKP